MISRRIALSALTTAALLLGSLLPAIAAPFEASAFAAAQADGKPILIHVTAPWCPTCKAQKPIVAQLRARDEFRTLVQFEIDFDTQKDLLRSFGVKTQSTLIVFKGKTEAGRSVGETRAEAIETLFRRAI
jgi:thioredoxin 1